MNPTLYPLKFRPIFKKTIWGGSEICSFKRVEIPVDSIGESWELSDVDGDQTIVSEGALEGWNIKKLMEVYGEELMGKHVFSSHSEQFPLLIKFIDAADDLSVQVHPNDDLARLRHNSMGKTEMWYVVNAEDGASLYAGFSRQIDIDEYVTRVEENTLSEVLRRYEVKAGDVFYLPAGRVHAICKGCFIAEIQQTSNITYRIYDYNRKDAEGKGRELHTELAKDAIDFLTADGSCVDYERDQSNPVTLVNTKYFKTGIMNLSSEMIVDSGLKDSFTVYMCIEGSAVLTDNNGYSLEINKGETVLIPASTSQTSIHPAPYVKFLDICM